MNTKEVAKEIGVKPATLAKAVYEERIPHPPLTSGNAYNWTPRYVEAARRYFVRTAIKK